MAQIVGNQLKLDNGSVITPQQGGWYDGQQYWGGTLSQKGQINPLSNQVGAGQKVSEEVNRQSASAQGKTYEEFNQYLQTPNKTVTPTVRAPSTGASATTTGTMGTGMGTMGTTETLNLPKLYESLYSTSGISDVEKQLSEKTAAYNAAVSNIKDNPYLSEATMTGRLKKLSDEFDADTAALQRDIATKKADIETKLNLETKQFDINSTAAQQALSQFNTLLGMGALTNATGEDIANITRSTGLSSAAIQSAIDASTKKDVKTSVQTFTDDNGVVTAVVMNSENGEIISKTSLGSIGNAEKATTAKATESDAVSAVGSIISSYLTNEQQQALISPEDLYRQLLLKYPLAASYIKDNWTADDIRSATQ